MKREFIVKTPLGNLKIHAKHSGDCPDDYPGIYVDLMLEDGTTEMLACIEYDSCYNRLQTCAYNPGIDEPVEVVAHEIG